MRSVVEYSFEVESSVGRVHGVLWDDGALGIGSPLVTDLDRSDVDGPDSLAAALQAVGLPEAEARAKAPTLWDNALEAFSRAAPRPPRLFLMGRGLWRKFFRSGG
jgi:hypothetical protein